MIDIEEELAVLAVDSLEHSYCFFGCYKEVSLVVNKNVERLENYHNALFFSDVGHFRESLYAYLKLFFAGHVKSFVAAMMFGTFIALAAATDSRNASTKGFLVSSHTMPWLHWIALLYS